MTRYTVITPTILRSTLARACNSLDSQTCKDWEHLVIVDGDMTGEVLEKIAHPQRTILRCEQSHKNSGNTCRHDAYKFATGDYLYYMDDDDYLSDDQVLEDLKVVTGAWAIFPILLHGSRLFVDPPALNQSSMAGTLVKREYGQWLDLHHYFTDGLLIEKLKTEHPYQVVDIRPVLIAPESHHGSMA